MLFQMHAWCFHMMYWLHSICKSHRCSCPYVKLFSTYDKRIKCVSHLLVLCFWLCKQQFLPHFNVVVNKSSTQSWGCWCVILVLQVFSHKQFWYWAIWNFNMMMMMMLEKKWREQHSIQWILLGPWISAPKFTAIHPVVFKITQKQKCQPWDWHWKLSGIINITSIDASTKFQGTWFNSCRAIFLEGSAGVTHWQSSMAKALSHC